MNWYIEMGGFYNINNNSVFGRKIYVTPKEIPNIRKRFNNTDVYATIFQYNNKNQDESDLIGPMYIDLDMDIKDEKSYKELVEDVKRIITCLNMYYYIPTKYIRFYFTGKKGFHIIIPSIVFNIEPDKHLNEYYKEIAKDLNNHTINKIIDTRIYDKKRLLRIANSINGKTGLYKVPIEYYNIMNSTYEQLKEYASSPKTINYEEPAIVPRAEQKFKKIIDDINSKRVKTNKKYSIPTNVDVSKIKFPECIEYIYNNGASEGFRNNTTIILASAFLQRGIDLETTMKLIEKWNAEKNDPMLSDSEVQNTINSAYHQVTNGKRYGCSSIKDLGLCQYKKCKIFK